MDNPGGRGDARFNLAYNMNLLSGETPPDIYANPMGRVPSTSLQQISPRHTMVTSVCGAQTSRSSSGLKGTSAESCYDERSMSSTQNLGIDTCGVPEIEQDTYTSMQPKKSPPSNGKKTKGRVKIKMEYIENKLRRYTTFSKRKTGIMKKAYELSTLTGTQVMLLVASETGHVYTFATRKLQPMITSEAGKALIQTCLNSPDPAGAAGPSGADQRMSATGFEETELTYNISDDDTKDDDMSPCGESSDSGSGGESPVPPTDHERPIELDFQGMQSGTSNGGGGGVKSVHGNKTSVTSGHSPLAGALPPGLTVYQTPEGAMYAAPTGSNGAGGVPTGAGVILSLQGNSPGAPPQFITIPLMGPPPVIAKSVAAKNSPSSATEELDLSVKTEKN